MERSCLRRLIVVFVINPSDNFCIDDIMCGHGILCVVGILVFFSSRNISVVDSLKSLVLRVYRQFITVVFNVFTIVVVVTLAVVVALCPDQIWFTLSPERPIILWPLEVVN
jgi:hypothetical protein